MHLLIEKITQGIQHDMSRHDHAASPRPVQLIDSQFRDEAVMESPAPEGSLSGKIFQCDQAPTFGCKFSDSCMSIDVAVR